MPKGKYWTEEQLNVLKEKVKEGRLSFAKIGLLINRSRSACETKSERLGLISSYCSTRKYYHNEDFWTPNPISCYFGGFAAADSNISCDKHENYFFRIELSKKDANHLEIFKRVSDYTGPIRFSNRGKKGDFASIYVYSDKWVKDLSNYYNITPKKTFTLQPPNLTDKYLQFCYLLGYLDGDGCVCFSRNKIDITLVGASFNMITWSYNLLMNLIENRALRKQKINIKKKNNTYVLCVTGMRACVLVDYFSKFNVPKLERKWQNSEILAHVAEQKSKHPHLFLDPPNF